MSTTIAEPPFTSDLAQRGGTMTQTWADWLVLQIVKRLQQASVTLASPATIAATAAIGVTAFNLPTISAGIYRIGWTARATTPAGTSSSLAVVVSYTRSGVSCTQTSAAMTSNATNLPESGYFEIHSDGGSPISYSTVYASVGAPSFAYELDVTCENVA